MLVQLWGTSDPHCIVSIGDNIAKTTHKERTLNPIWDEELQLYVRHVNSICLPTAATRVLGCSFRQSQHQSIMVFGAPSYAMKTAPCCETVLKRGHRNSV